MGSMGEEMRWADKNKYRIPLSILYTVQCTYKFTAYTVLYTVI